MSTAAQERPSRGGKPRRWRETHKYRLWFLSELLFRRKAVVEAYGNLCAVTGRPAKTAGDLDAHHLYSTTTYPHLTYKVENGILLHKEIHTLFHQKFGYTSNTLEQFLSFLIEFKKYMPISSQGELENSQGSETRVYDPERVRKLHERLEGIRLSLQIED